MYGKDCYTEDRKPEEHFLRQLRSFDGDLVCAWNNKRGIFEILRPRSPDTVTAMHAQGFHEPYDVVLECATTKNTKILDAEGVECAMRIPRDPGPWVFHELRSRDTWQPGVAKANEAFREHFKQTDLVKAAERHAFFDAHSEEGYAAVCKDLNVARRRLSFGVNGLRKR
jgi:hypothetical protein